AARLIAVTPTNNTHGTIAPPPANAATAAAAAPMANDSMKKRTGVKTSARAKATTAISQIQRQVSGELTSMAAAPAVLPRRYRAERVPDVRGREVWSREPGRQLARAPRNARSRSGVPHSTTSVT